jgi:hypothetical protein
MTDDSKYVETVFNQFLELFVVTNHEYIAPFLEVNSKEDDVYCVSILVKRLPPSREGLEGGHDGSI